MFDRFPEPLDADDLIDLDPPIEVEEFDYSELPSDPDELVGRWESDPEIPDFLTQRIYSRGLIRVFLERLLADAEGERKQLLEREIEELKGASA